MAEKQLAYRGSEKEEFFADDDPLAELARIVGFEPRPVAPAAPVAQRQEPAFDLEDELLREFERYDAPRAAAVDDVPLSLDETAFDDAAAYDEPVNSNDPHYTHQQFAAQAAEPQPQPQSFAPEPLSAQAHESTWQQATAYEEPAAEPQPRNEMPSNFAEAPAANPAGARDLIEELEMSIGAPASAPASAPSRATPQWAAASIRLPLANFNVAKRIETPAAEIAPAAPETVLPVEPITSVEDAPVGESLATDAMDAPTAVFSGFPSEQDRHEVAEAHPVAVEAIPDTFDEPAFDLIAAARDGDVHPDAALSEPPYEGTAVEAFGIDDLLDDVSRYPVPQRDRSADYPVEAKPENDVEAVLSEPAMVAPQPIAVAPPIAEPAAPAAEQPVAMSDEDPFADQDFDFDLESIELELAELDFAEAKAPAPQPTVVSPPLPAAPSATAAMTAALAAAAEPARASFDEQIVPPQPRTPPALRPELAARPAEAPILHAPRQPVPAAPVQETYQPATPVLDIDQPLPFDPSEISETDDRVESFEGMHVPTLPAIEKEEPVALPPEYDFDIDAEMASLFGTPSKDVAEPAKAPAPAASVSWARATATSGAAAAPTASVAAPAAAAPAADGLDEFERALEEDFRRSVHESQPPAERVTRMTIEPSMVIADRQRARSMRGLAVAAVAVLVVGGGAYAGYKWLGHGTTLLASGEPRVITADKDPVKVVPQNPGGKVVPNQDKAVYDRVAGDVATAPKQKELVSSDEQPMDVVQKTLVPDASPDDSDGGGDPSVSTPVGDTEDPRLLPNQGGDNANAAASGSQDDDQSVAPRKVRTMIVKPDGTLVARQDDGSQSAVTPAKQPTPGTPKLAPATSGMNAPAVNQIASANPVTSASDAANAESTPIRVVKTTKVADAGIPAAGTPLAAPAASAPAAAAPTPVQAAPTPAQPAPAAAAVPAARPQTPKPVAHAATPATEVASASPKTQPVQAAPAASAGAGGYVVQIASLPTEADAKKSQANLSAKFGSVIGGHPVEIKKFDISGKGTYYRVRVVAGTKDAAADLCVKYRAAGGTCLISK